MKKQLFFLLFAALLGVFASCGRNYYNEEADSISVGSEHPATGISEIISDDADASELHRFNDIFIDLFDTATIVIGYASSQQEFDYFSRNVIRAELYRLHQLFDIFNEYPEINNIWTINNSAGSHPVNVDPVIIELLKLCIEAYHSTNGIVNAALGPVTNIWREHISSDREPVVPSMDILREASILTNINNVIIDEENNTVFLKYEGMSLDVGAIAKGFAIEAAVQKAIEAGFDSFFLSVGGDVRVAGGPISGVRDTWSLGIQDPTGEREIVDAVYATHTSVFSSGDYQRFFIVDDVRYHHIIDPRTLMPAINYRAVTIIYPDGGMADILSTAAFILDINEAKPILADFGAEAIWILNDGTIITTEGYWQYSRSDL